MKQKLFSLFFLTSLLFINLLSFSQGKINGTVTDENGNALEGASIQIKGASSSTVADGKGRYILSNEQKFPWTILVSHTSYQGKEFSVSKQGVHNFSLTEFVSLGGVTIVGSRGKARTGVNRPVFPMIIFNLITFDKFYIFLIFIMSGNDCLNFLANE